MKSKLAATLFALFLGGFGVHKFYLNENACGCLYLLFFWTGIPSIVALIDFLILLTTSEVVFNAKYNNLQPVVTYPLQPQSKKDLTSERLDIQILKICRTPGGATISDCVIETGAKPEQVQSTIQVLLRKSLLTVDNRVEDGVVVYKSI